ncbi:MAG: bifunctional diaminohydroxyphosphoribosylaminopyrimidine deaminase/5-amino-6-(5-phosphoribosylamino)uracil reductase RibD [Sphingomonadaceae bacterium]|nr:bifunctional diaminohydroxyphosphoribosylaminopyrimidine deaminase/5-amino-6-(5-phosphoribosylamino)uracil reductase RibD [Sphingomonadaceae bacterium]
MAAALALAERGLGRTGNNPSVGCLIVNAGKIVGRGWTQPGGRPHAEAMALEQAGEQAAGATVYVTLEPCAHLSDRGPACASIIRAARPKRVVVAIEDPDPRTSGKGIALLREAGIPVDSGVLASAASAILSGFRSRIVDGRPHVTLKLATSLDGRIAMSDGSSRWITGGAARAHAHFERARCDAILVGAGTVRVDHPALDVRLPGMGDRNPRRVMLGSGDPPQGWEAVRAVEDIGHLDCNNLLVEGGALTASAFLRADLVDRLLLYRAPLLIGAGKACLGDIGLGRLSDAHGRWQLLDTRRLGNDRLEVYQAIR